MGLKEDEILLHVYTIPHNGAVNRGFQNLKLKFNNGNNSFNHATTSQNELKP
jgi:hypothetical protein